MVFTLGNTKDTALDIDDDSLLENVSKNVSEPGEQGIDKKSDDDGVPVETQAALCGQSSLGDNESLSSTEDDKSKCLLSDASNNED